MERTSDLKSMGDNAFPICPEHDSFMVEYNFEPWEAILPQGTLEAFQMSQSGMFNRVRNGSG